MTLFEPTIQLLDTDKNRPGCLWCKDEGCYKCQPDATLFSDDNWWDEAVWFDYDDIPDKLELDIHNLQDIPMTRFSTPTSVHRFLEDWEESPVHKNWKNPKTLKKKKEEKEYRLYKRLLTRALEIFNALRQLGYRSTNLYLMKDYMVVLADAITIEIGKDRIYLHNASQSFLDIFDIVSEDLRFHYFIVDFNKTMI